ncbi:FdhE protein [Pseudoduganella lurida]|uniref:FdhE protein n=1 Tax=Pseudoduganella lurida TaxID=1036180 RepID=A0A562RLQ2_9BURK|nr:formate dehydrogenase accessory protein FdhE [Pseudoduganella lurida]TWI69534.1 FdhE protein [Pseudoduganella lurida]
MVQRLLEPGEIEGLDHTAIPRLLLPQPGVLYTARAERLRQLAANNIQGTSVDATLSSYVKLMAELVQAQADVVATLLPAGIPLPDTETMRVAHEHNMPVLPATGQRPAEWRAVYAAILDRLATKSADQPQLVTAIAALRALDEAQLEGAADAVLGEFAEGIDPLHAPFIAAALQATWSLMASQLDECWAQPLITGTLCPVCGSHPVASVIRIGGQSQGYRYLHCQLCASEWHMVRVKCSCCESTSKIAYQGLTDAEANLVEENIAAAREGKMMNKANDPTRVARAETCDECHTYRKIFNQEHDYNVDPLADDLASLVLDVLVSELGYARASGNPLLRLGSPA